MALGALFGTSKFRIYFLCRKTIGRVSVFISRNLSYVTCLYKMTEKKRIVYAISEMRKSINLEQDKIK